MGFVDFLSGVQGYLDLVPINAMVALFVIGGSRVIARWLLSKIEDASRAKNNQVNSDQLLMQQSKPR